MTLQQLTSQRCNNFQLFSPRENTRNYYTPVTCYHVISVIVDLIKHQSERYIIIVLNYYVLYSHDPVKQEDRTFLFIINTYFLKSYKKFSEQKIEIRAYREANSTDDSSFSKVQVQLTQQSFISTSFSISSSVDIFTSNIASDIYMLIFRI